MTAEQGEIDKSIYGSDFKYLWRIQYILDRTTLASVQNDAYLWFRWLCALYRALSIKMDNGKQEEFDNRIKEINPLISKYAQNLESRDNSSPRLDSELYFNLHKFEIDLLAIANKYGLLLKAISADDIDYI